MSLKDFVKLMMFDSDKLKVFDKEDNLLFKGNKRELQEILYQKQTFAVKRIATFYVVNEIIIINVN